MPLEPQTPAATEPPPAAQPRAYGWQRKFTSILLIIFTFEIGCFLVAFPWVGVGWENNFFSSLLHRSYWDNGYFRGAVSGLGVLNLYISLAEALRLHRNW